jgi:NitT/TauT family transport system ATP-binding protein
MENPIIFSHVNKSYKETPNEFVVRDFNLSIREKEFFCLVGPSGCGKSTVMKMIAGIASPTSGTLVKPDRVGMVFQSGALLPWLTVEDNISFAGRMQGFGREKISHLTHVYLEMVHLEKYEKRYPRELSGGQRQRVGIARALMVESNVLLMDEPFSALDPIITDELHNDLMEIWGKTKKTIVMVSHRFEEAVFLADRIGIMGDGKLEHVLPVTSPRPRKAEQKEFVQEVERIHNFMARESAGME